MRGHMCCSAQALKSENIKVLCVNPAQTHTPMTTERPDAHYIPEKMIQVWAASNGLFPRVSARRTSAQAPCMQVCLHAQKPPCCANLPLWIHPRAMYSAGHLHLCGLELPMPASCM